jgi:serine/threonine protein kinase
VSLESTNSAPEEGAGDEADLDDLVGQVIGGTYLLVRAIGEGGTGRVYEATHVRIPSKRFAVKVLHAEYLRHPEAWVRFQREAEAVGSIDHPNVVDVFDVNRTDDERPFVVFAYLEGKELAEFIEERGPLPPPLAADIVQQVCDGLTAAHERGVIHRDIKPQNVFLVGDLSAPEVRVLDFGLSRLLDDAATSVTKTGMLLGTPVYMAPEQARGERADMRADIYGAGTILYATLTGHPPFEEENLQRTLIAVMGEDPVRPRVHVPILDEGLELVVQRAMAKEPEDRYPSAESLARALDPYVRSYSRPPPSQRPPASSLLIRSGQNEGQASRSTLVVYLVASLVLALAAMATMVVGVAELFGAVSAREVALLILAFIGTALTPVVLAIRHLRRSVWDNGVKVRELRRRVRRVVIAAAAAYGLSALGLRVLDTVVSLFVVDGPFGVGGGPGWVPLNIVYVVVAAVAAGLAWALGRKQAQPNHMMRRGAIATVVLLSFVLVVQSVRFRAAEMTTQTAQVSLTALDGLRPEDVARIVQSGARVPSDELADAVAHGLATLMTIRERYPRDPEVLQAVALAQGRDETKYPEAVKTLEMLFGIKPDYVQDRALRVLISKAAQRASSRDAALSLMVTGMGSGGLDLLYDLMIRSKALRPKIETMFASAEIRERFSPALAIAHDLRMASDCAARSPLLDRAQRLGDERTIAVLAPLAQGAKTGCGRWKRSRCKPPCPTEAKAFQTVVHAIQDRLRQ